jgi:MFS family permease
MIGSLLERRGPRLILVAAVLTTGTALLMLSQVKSLIAFYILFCVARMNFAGPFDLGIYGVVSNWFIARRAAASIANLAEKTGLVLLPLLAYAIISPHDWRTAWLAIGATVLVVGLVPPWLLIVRRPEDVGQIPDGGHHAKGLTKPAGVGSAVPRVEPVFTRAEALRTRAFWMLSLFTLMVYPVQAGMSLHQAAHFIERGLGDLAAAASVSAFSFSSIVSTLAFGMILTWISIRAALAMTCCLLVGAALTMAAAANVAAAAIAAVLFGLGVGGLQVVLPVAWADYFGRRNFGAIRGVALTVQVTAQAMGPLVSGLLRDWSGDYLASLTCFALLSAIGALAALLIKAPVFPRRLA